MTKTTTTQAGRAGLAPSHDVAVEEAESPAERTSAAQGAPDDAQVQEGAADGSDVQDALRTLCALLARWLLRETDRPDCK